MIRQEKSAEEVRKPQERYFWGYKTVMEKGVSDRNPRVLKPQRGPQPKDAHISAEKSGKWRGGHGREILLKPDRLTSPDSTRLLHGTIKKIENNQQQEKVRKTGGGHGRSEGSIEEKGKLSVPALEPRMGGPIKTNIYSVTNQNTRNAQSQRY